MTSSTCTIEDSSISGNYAKEGGAAVKILGGMVNMTSSVVKENTAGKYGAAFDISVQGDLSSVKTSFYLYNSEISNNFAPVHGAGMYADDFHDFLVQDTVFRNNSGMSNW